MWMQVWKYETKHFEEWKTAAQAAHPVQTRRNKRNNNADYRRMYERTSTRIPRKNGNTVERLIFCRCLRLFCATVKETTRVHTFCMPAFTFLLLFWKKKKKNANTYFLFFSLKIFLTYTTPLVDLLLYRILFRKIWIERRGQKGGKSTIGAKD